MLTAALSPEIRDFLAHGTRTAKLGFVAADGRPLVAPVWFVVEGDELWFNTGWHHREGAGDRARPTPGGLRRHGAAAVRVRAGPGGRDGDGGPGRAVASATLIGRRYMGADRAEEFGRRNGVPGELLVKLRPTKVVTDLNVTS